MDFLQPENLEEALDLLSKERGKITILAGGTDLIPDIRSNIRKNSIVMDISRLPELRGMEESEREIKIGALVTHREIVESQPVIDTPGLLIDAAKSIGSPQIRSIVTIG